ncbi:MAG: beta-aspartyl-peptidase [Bacteroidota bacterium]|nr:beta-aspartyl-peptidase [Bacteroidota bacterium]
MIRSKTIEIMTLIEKTDVYAPEYLGKTDILIGGGKILAVGNNLIDQRLSKIDMEIIDGSGLKTIPGLIDGHVHIAGSGGEGGPSTRTPELQLSQMLRAGVTTVIGLLGTDGMTRNLEGVLMKVKSLRAEGVSAWMYTGAYQVPTPTILGDVGRDISLIDEIIGVGEVAISDHRSSEPSVRELIRMAVHARIGGMFSGKSGIVNLHIGNRKNPFDLIYKAVERSDLQFTQFLPTHCNRNDHLLAEAKTYGKTGYIDLTAYPKEYGYENNKASRAVVELLAAGVPLNHITVTSDGCGSLPVFEEGKLIKLGIGSPDAIFHTLIELVGDEGMPWEKALPVVTSNPADILKLTNKGRIAVSKDADLVLLDDKNEIEYLFANGAIMTREGKLLRKGTFED